MNLVLESVSRVKYLPDQNNVHIPHTLVTPARAASKRPVTINKKQHHWAFRMKQRKTG